MTLSNVSFIIDVTDFYNNKSTVTEITIPWQSTVCKTKWLTYNWSKVKVNTPGTAFKMTLSNASFIIDVTDFHNNKSTVTKMIIPWQSTVCKVKVNCIFVCITSWTYYVALIQISSYPVHKAIYPWADPPWSMILSGTLSLFTNWEELFNIP